MKIKISYLHTNEIIVIAQDVTSITTFYILFSSMKKTYEHKIAVDAQYTNQSRAMESKHFPKHFFPCTLSVCVLSTD
jgi:hypothetical protein